VECQDADTHALRVCTSRYGSSISESWAMTLNFTSFDAAIPEQLNLVPSRGEERLNNACEQHIDSRRWRTPGG